MIGYLALLNVGVVDVSGLSYELEVVNQRISIRILVPPLLLEVSSQIRVVCNYKDPLIRRDAVLLPVVFEHLVIEVGV